MKITEKGLVLRQVKLREADKILTLLLPEHGVVSASVRGAMRPNSKFFSASGLYTYSEWTLHAGKTMYSVDEATPIEVFFGLRNSVEAVALAAYMAEIVQVLSPTGDEADRLLRLVLNCLHLLSEGARDTALVKAVFELRAMAQSGFMPDVTGCVDCDLELEAETYFDVGEGGLFCPACAMNQNLSPNLNAAATAALRHIVACDDERVFSFRLGAKGQAMLARMTERYLLQHMDWPPKSLAFLKTVL